MHILSRESEKTKKKNKKCQKSRSCEQTLRLARFSLSSFFSASSLQRRSGNEARERCHRLHIVEEEFLQSRLRILDLNRRISDVVSLKLQGERGTWPSVRDDGDALSLQRRLLPLDRQHAPRLRRLGRVLLRQLRLPLQSDRRLLRTDELRLSLGLLRMLTPVKARADGNAGEPLPHRERRLSDRRGSERGCCGTGTETRTLRTTAVTDNRRCVRLRFFDRVELRMAVNDEEFE